MFGGSLFRTFASEVLESQNTDSCGRCTVRKWKLGLYSERWATKVELHEISFEHWSFKTWTFRDINQKLQEDIHDEHLKLFAENESILSS